MKTPAHHSPGYPIGKRQSGTVLIITLMLLVAITVIALASVQDSAVNLRIVGNTQFQQSAKAVAQAAIERVLATPAVFEVTNPADVSEVLDGWGVTVHTRYLGCPCGSATNEGQSLSAQQQFNVRFSVDTACWDLEARVADPATGTSVVLHQGIERKQGCPGV